MDEIWWNWMNMDKNRWKRIKCMKIDNIDESGWNWMKVYNYREYLLCYMHFWCRFFYLNLELCKVLLHYSDLVCIILMMDVPTLQIKLSKVIFDKFSTLSYYPPTPTPKKRLWVREKQFLTPSFITVCLLFWQSAECNLDDG